MPGIVSDPSSLTKQKLKTELSKFGVTLPSSDSKKAVYVELYRQHVSSNSMRSEFSSDDDDALGTSRPKKKKAPSKKLLTEILEPEPEPDSAMVNVTSLSDETLADMLRECGVDVGPITETTRLVYERKLAKEMSSGDARGQTEQVYQPEEDNYNDYSADDDTLPMEDDPEPYSKQSTWQQEEVSVRYRPPQDPSSRTSDYSRRPMARTEYTSSSGGATSYSSTTTSSSSTKQSSSATKPEDKKSSAFSICIQLGILAVVALIIFLVISNMEPGRKSVDVIDTDIP